jgi:hypothetical protein
VLQLRLAEITKKVDMASGSAVIDVDGASPSDETSAADVVSGPRSIEGGTLMRDLVRAEIDRTQIKTPIQQLFDNTWFLIGAFVLLIILAFWWVRSREVDPDALFQRGEELMAKAPGPAWETARDECFTPLLEIDEDLDEPVWGPKIEPYLSELSLYEIANSRLRNAGTRERPPANDVERFVQRSLMQRQIGDYEGARLTLEAVLDLLPEDEQHGPERVIIEQLIEDLPAAQAETPSEFVTAAAERARALDAAGETAQAREIWQSIILLYGEDDAHQEIVTEARQALE